MPRLLGPDARELLRRPVEQRDLAGRIDGDHPALDRRDDVVEMLVGQDDLRVELRVLHCDAGLVGERHQEIEVLGIERVSGELGPDHDCSDDPVFGHQGQDERPVQTRQLTVKAFEITGEPPVRNLVGEQEVLRACERGDDFYGRLVRRVEVTLLVALLGYRPGEG